VEAAAVSIVDAGARKAFDLKVEVPVEDMARLGRMIEPSDDEIPRAGRSPHRGVDLARHAPAPLELIRAHRSTLIFVNSRRLAERLSGAINELAGEEIARAHHGSIAREQRVEMEGRAQGRAAARDDRHQLARAGDRHGCHRPGRAGGDAALRRLGHPAHRPRRPPGGAVSRGIIFPKYRGDLLATAALTARMQDGAVEATRIPQNPLDVLAQQLVAMSAGGEWGVDDLYRVVKRAAPFARLPRAQFEGVLDMLSGRYPSDEFAELRPRLTWDRLRGRIRPRRARSAWRS
jgi:ATP-dependent Lhr-like helicase